MTVQSTFQNVPADPERAAAPGVVMLDRDLSDLLVEFSLALGHQAAYPPGHPMLVAAGQRLAHAVTGALARRPSLSLGVARRQFVIDGVLTDPRNGLLGNLAHRLHRHRIAALRFERGVSQAEISALLAAIGRDPRREPGPLGLRPENERRWTHAEVYAAQYDRLELAESGTADADDEAGSRERQLWLELARTALPEDGGADLSGGSHPGVIAAAINRRREVTYDEAVVAYLTRVAEEVGTGETVEQAWLRRRLSRLIASLDPAALDRLLRVGASGPDHRRFVMAASQTLGADAVLRVVEAAAESAGRGISDNLMLLLRKLAAHAETDEAGPSSNEADEALRDNVGRLVSEWELEDPNPEAYTSALQAMASATRPQMAGVRTDLDLDAAELLRIGLEVGELGPRVMAAAARLVADGQTRVLHDLLDAAAGAGLSTESVWSEVATADLLTAELSRQPVDFDVVAALVVRMREAASGPLLDALASSQDRSTRWNLLRLLGEVGAPAASEAAARLPDAPWFVQRNLLLLIGRLGSWPEGFSPAPYVTHQDSRVRREAYRLLLDSAGTREPAIVQGLSDPDPGIVSMVLTAAQPACPPDAISSVERIAGDQQAGLEVRSLAVRVLAAAPDPDREVRLATIVRQRRWWGGIRLAPRSPILLAVLRALADSRSDHPDVLSALALARRHRDPEIRSAAGGAAP